MRLATSWVEPAYLEPDASWCEPGGEPASPLANGGAFGGKEHSLRARRRARARDARSAARCASSTRARTSCGSARSARRSRRPRCGATDASRSTARAVRDRARRRARRAYGMRGRRALASGRRPGPAGRRRAARVRARRAGGARRGRARRGRRRPIGRSPTTPRCSTRSSSRRRARAPARGSTFDDATGRARPASRCGSRRAIRSTRPCCGRTRSARRTWRSAGCSPSRSRSIPTTGEVHDLTIRSFGIIRARDMPPVTITILDDRRAAARAFVRRGLRRRRRRNLERARSRRRRPARYVPRARHPRVAVCSGGSRCPSTPVPRRARRRSPARTHPRCARATGSCSRARSASTPRRGKLADGVEAQARQVLANIAAVLGDCGASADRRRQDARVRHRPRRLRDRQRGVRGGVRRPPSRRVPRSRSPASPAARSSRSKPGPTSAGKRSPRVVGVGDPDPARDLFVIGPIGDLRRRRDLVARSSGWLSTEDADDARRDASASEAQESASA